MLWTLGIAAAILLAACSPARSGGGNAAASKVVDAGRAAPVPTLVVTAAQAGTTLAAEAGDRVEVHVPAEAGSERWQLRDHRGEAVTLVDERVGPGRNGEHAPPVRIFRFSATAVGRSSLVFRRGEEALAFAIEVR